MHRLRRLGSWIGPRAKMLRRWGALIRGNGMSRGFCAILQWLARHPAVGLGLPLAWAVEQSAPALSNVPQAAVTLHQAILIGGVGSLVAQLPWRGAVGAHEDHGPASLAGLALALERLVLICLALASIRQFGTELAVLFAFAKTNSDLVIALVAVAAFLRIIGAPVPSRSGAVGSEAPRGTAVLSSTRPPRSPQDIYRTAVHEAGHLLLYAVCDDLPDDLRVTVLAEIGASDDYVGQVTHSDDRPEVVTEGYLWWSMLRHLGGMEAELVVLGDRGDGAGGDNSNWIATATWFLSNGFRQVFYAQSSEEGQREHNRAVLNELKVKCTEIVRGYLSLNAELLVELARVIADEMNLTRDRIEPFLRRAVCTECLALDAA